MLEVGTGSFNLFDHLLFEQIYSANKNKFSMYVYKPMLNGANVVVVGGGGGKKIRWSPQL